MDYYNRLFNRYPQLRVIKKEIWDAFTIMKEAFTAGKKLLICGNGGSAADAEHIVGELMKGFHLSRQLCEEEQQKYGVLAQGLQGALPAIALSNHAALSTAFSNDVDPHMVFAQQVYGYGECGDVFLGISTSGNSQNVVNAALVARGKGMKVVTFLGKSGGKLKELSDVAIIVPGEDTADIQELHLPVYHALCSMLEEAFWGEQCK